MVVCHQRPTVAAFLILLDLLVLVYVLVLCVCPTHPNRTHIGADKKHAPSAIRAACEAMWDTQPEATQLVLMVQLYTDDEVCMVVCCIHA